MMAEPMKTLELHYPMIQFLIILVTKCQMGIMSVLFEDTGILLGSFGDHQDHVIGRKACHRFETG